MYQPKKKNAYEFTKSENAASQQVPYRIGGHDAAYIINKMEVNEHILDLQFWK